MHAVDFIQDIAIVMLVAGLVTVLCHRFKQPVVLGYIFAGVILGPYTPPFQLIEDEHTTKILAELGVVFLLFSLGLEFSFKKLAKVGGTAFIAALTEIVLMIWIGFEIGRFFNWGTMDSLFLGAMLAISSTTIIVKALDELGMKQEKFAQLIFGVLIVEDILAIGMIALLSGIAMTGSVDAGDVFATVGKLSLFMTVALVLGLLVVPRLLTYVARFHSKEMLLITVLGLLFGFCLLVIKLDYSVALGAFMIGAIMAEARELHLIERLIEPIRDMFSAIFFVTIGLMFDPGVLMTYAWPIAIITVAVIAGKVLTCGMGTFLAGHDARTSMRVGMGLSQIGEFSFIIAALGLTLKVTSDFLYPIVVAVSAITTLLTPYLIKLADPLAEKSAKAMPPPVARMFGRYTNWLHSMQLEGDRAIVARIIMRIVLQILINCALLAAVFLAGVYVVSMLEQRVTEWIADEDVQKAVVWGGALLISLPVLIATYRKLKALSMLLAELYVPAGILGRHANRVRSVISEVMPILLTIGILMLVFAMTVSILPSPRLVAIVLGLIGLLATLLWKPSVKLYAKFQIALVETLEQKPDEKW